MNKMKKMKNIVIIGAGHGGLVAGAKLAQNGFNVSIFEKLDINSFGYDFTDVFDATCFQKVGIDFDASKLKIKQDMTVISPSQRVSLTPHILAEDCEQRMERKDICKILVEFATSCGVKIFDNSKVKRLIFDENNKVVGIEKQDEEMIFADLIIDSAGFESPFRKDLQDRKLMNFNEKIGDFLFAYRATFNKESEAKEPYKIYLYPESIQGIAWVVCLDDEVDVLIGSISKLETARIDEILDFLRRGNECLGKDKIRCGEVFKIPITKPLDKFYSAGYVVVGDGARMTVPLIGSGITNSVLAGGMLAEKIVKNDISEETLRRFQAEYMSKMGNEDASLHCIKEVLLSLDSDSVDFLFDKKIVTPNDLLTCLAGHRLKLSVKDFIIRGFRGLPRINLLLKFAKAYFKSRKI